MSFWIFGIIIGLFLLFAFLPNLAFIFPLLIIPFLFRFIPSIFWYWLLRILGIALLLFFAFSLISLFSHGVKFNPRPFDKDNSEEKKHYIEPVLDSLGNPTNDSLIIHYREWNDYDGKKYSGRFWVRKSDFNVSSNYKNNLFITDASSTGYDNLLKSLIKKDKKSLDGIYQLFDSLQKSNNLNNKHFAEMVVSFVQDIPYAVILPYDCNPDLYSDEFTRSYLLSPDAICDGNENFGINTPVEFLANLKGDCDTRTLLLFTVLSHYNYDVAILTSEQYSHSILGININYSGKAVYYSNQRYVMWETTAPDIKPGVMPEEFANTNYWRISLKSK